MPYDDKNCGLNGENDKLQAIIFSVMIDSKLTSTYHKLLHVDSTKFYSHDVAAAIDELMRTSFSCMPSELDPKEKARMRAELLALYARMKASDTQAVGDVRVSSPIKADLERAIAALDLGQELIDRNWENCSISPRNTEILDAPFNEVISGNSIQETCAELKTPRAGINTMISQ